MKKLFFSLLIFFIIGQINLHGNHKHNHKKPHLHEKNKVNNQVTISTSENSHSHSHSHSHQHKNNGNINSNIVNNDDNHIIKESVDNLSKENKNNSSNKLKNDHSHCANHSHQGHGHSHSHSHSNLDLENNAIHKFIYSHLTHYMESYNKETQSYLAVLFVSLIPFPIFLIIIILRLNNKFILILLTAFSAGSLLGDIIYHNLVEIFNSEETIEIVTGNIYLDEMLKKEMFICYGLVFVFLFEKLLISFGHSAHSHSHNHNHDDKYNESNKDDLNNIVEDLHKSNSKKNKKDRVSCNEAKHLDNSTEESDSNASNEIKIAFLNDFVHNLTDGIAIAATFKINFKLGVSNLIAVTLHEIPHEIADFSFLLKRKSSLLMALFNQILAAMGAVLGVYLSKLI